MPSLSTALPSSGNRHILLIDGYGFVFRAYHSMPSLTRADGVPIGAVYGFTNMLMKLLHDSKADHVAVILDKGRKNFRHDLYADYKANRPPAPPDLVPQFPMIRDAAEALNLPVVEFEGYEADDIIATYARIAQQAGETVTIVSSDKDLMQLVGNGVVMYDPLKNRMIGEKEVQEKFGVMPDKVLDMLALIGDSADNIPGVPGIGPKTAAELINNFGDLDTVLARAGEIKQTKRREMLIEHADTARLSRDLAALCETAPVTLTLSDLVLRPADPEKLIAFLTEQGFKNLLGRVVNQQDTPQPKQSPANTQSPPKECVIIYTETLLNEWVTKIEDAGKVTLRFYNNDTDITGLALLTAHNEACYIPIVNNKTLDSNADLFAEKPSLQEGVPLVVLCNALLPMLHNPSVLKIGYDIKAMMVLLKQPDITPYNDIMLMSYVLDAGINGHELDALINRHLEKELPSLKTLTGTGKASISLSEVATETMATYALIELDMVQALHTLLKARLFEAHMLTVYETLERPLIPVLANMELKGVKADPVRLMTLSDEFGIKITALEKEIHQLAGHSFNIGSPKQLGEILFQEMGIKGAGKTATGAYSTGAEVLEELALQGHVIADKILEWRQLSKLKSTYTDALIKQINPHTKRIHTHFQMAVASTGRLSSNNPNLQNIPIRTEEGHKIRSAFIAEKGCKLLAADYSQIELRLLAHMANIDTLKTAFAEGKDIHTITASQVFGIPLEEIDSATRRKAKAINFGIIYGISAFGLARQLGIGRAEASQYIQAYFKEYPGIETFMETTKAFAREHGYVETLFGRRCHVMGINDKNQGKRSFAERAAINAPLQGTAADIIKKAMIQLPPALKAAGLQGEMILQVHDELVLEVPDAEIEQTKALIEKIMVRVVQLEVPLEVDVGIGNNWAEM